MRRIGGELGRWGKSGHTCHSIWLPLRCGNGGLVMIVLNEEQGLALAASRDPVTVVNPKTNERYVLVMSGVYERLRLLLEEQDRALNGRQLAVLVDRAMSEY